MVGQLILRLISWRYRLHAIFDLRGAGRSAARLFFTPRKPVSGQALEREPDWQGALETGYARRWGTGSDLVFLLHGWEGSWTQFSAFIAPFESMGMSVITLDPPAHGSAGAKTSSPRQFADTLLAAQAEFGAPELVVGHSLGGSSVMLGLSNGLSAQGVVLVSAPYSPESVIEQFEALLRMTPKLKRALRQEIDDIVGVPLERMGANSLLDGCRTPGLILHDREDRRIGPGDGEKIAAAWPAAELIYTEGFGHSRILNEQTASLITAWVGQGPASQTGDHDAPLKRAFTTSRHPERRTNPIFQSTNRRFSSVSFPLLSPNCHRRGLQTPRDRPAPCSWQNARAEQRAREASGPRNGPGRSVIGLHTA